jgi:hypothetical protein
MLTVTLRPRLRAIGLPKQMEKMLKVPLSAGGMIVQSEAQVLLGTQGPTAEPGDTWPAYFNKQLRAWVLASRPIMPPHRQTGALQQSIKRTMISKSEIGIGSSLDYARKLEYGEAKMKGKRPFMRPALYASVDRILRSFYHFLGV